MWIGEMALPDGFADEPIAKNLGDPVLFIGHITGRCMFERLKLDAKSTGA